MTIESIALNTYFGVELIAATTETPQTVAYLICKAANEVGTLFHRLEVLDTTFVGGRKFVRCRSDLLNPFPMLELLYKRGRGTIMPQDKGYVIMLVSGKMGPMSNVTMHSTPKPGQRASYRGPKHKLWARQFE